MARDRLERLAGSYERIYEQLVELFLKNEDPTSRMATAVALLHHKMAHYYWTGFYRLSDGDLLVGPYQGPLACSILERDKGVCWACVQQGEPILVADVQSFEGHIACDARSLSEVVVPVRDSQGKLRAVLDVDAKKMDAFCQTDVDGLLIIAELIFKGESSASV